jgi:HK97 family phage major capsid protein
MEAMLKDLQTKLGQLTEDFRARLAALDEERQRFGSETAETKATVAKLNAAIQAIEDRQRELQLKLARVAAVPVAGDGMPSLERKTAWLKACRQGFAALSAEEAGLVHPTERKALLQGDDTTGGFLTVPEIEQEILKGIVLMSPFRSVTRVTTIGSRSLQIRKRTGTFAASWTGEGVQQTEATGLTYGLEEIYARQLTAFVDISNENLEDSAFDLEGELSAEAAEQFGVAEGKAFISGSGTQQPEGILTNTQIAQVNSGASGALTADGLIKIWGALKSGYQGTWLFNRGTLAAIRQLKDSNGQYLWQPGLAGNVPNQILGSPYVEMPDMPDVAANALAVAYGDFRRGYRIVERLAMTVLRDPFSQATRGMVRFVFRRRVGGQVINPDAIKLQKIAA